MCCFCKYQLHSWSPPDSSFSLSSFLLSVSQLKSATQNRSKTSPVTRFPSLRWAKRLNRVGSELIVSTFYENQHRRELSALWSSCRKRWPEQTQRGSTDAQSVCHSRCSSAMCVSFFPLSLCLDTRSLSLSVSSTGQPNQQLLARPTIAQWACPSTK